MIKCIVTNKSINQIEKSRCYIFLATQDSPLSKEYTQCAQHTQPNLQKAVEESGFTAKALEIRVLPVMKDDHFIYPIFVGLGKKEARKAITIETYRRALGHAYKKAISSKSDSVVLILPEASLFNCSYEYLAEQTIITLTMASYYFDDYITDESRKENPLKEVTIIVDGEHKKAVNDGIASGQIIAQAVNKARHWVDLPPMVLTPHYLAEQAEKIAQANDLKATIFSEKEIIKMGMGGLAGVSRGSELDCKLVILEYRSKKKTAPTVAFVGKGITFDSGGLSLKPAASMETMKEDMSGAAAVIATMEAIAQLKPDINIIGIAPISENLPSGSATKPGDILRFYNGKTAEVKNTDAEGRLILADALSYAVAHYKLDAIIDLATLTGSCAHALGPFFSGLMSQHDDLVAVIKEAADRSGDRVWRLPMDNDFKVAVRSEVADMCNIGSAKYRAGAITASFFLQNFVGDVPWAHLDIAGTAFDVPDIPYYRSGATGAGVRLLIDIAMHW